MKKILFYTNQFFGQIGGEDMAYAEPQVFEGMHGSANTFGAPLKDIAEIVATISAISFRGAPKVLAEPCIPSKT